MLPNGRYLVTGATGLIGRHVLDLLLASGQRGITATCWSTPPHRESPQFSWRRANLADPATCTALVSGHDYVIHSAGVVAPGQVLACDPVGPVRRNLAITGNIHEACWRGGVRKLVWFSSTTGYPADGVEIGEDDMFRGDPADGWYGLGWAHRYLETQSRMYAEKLQPALDVVALRPSLVYGPRDEVDAETAHFVYAFARQVAGRHAPIQVRGDGSQARDLIHARDVARAALLAVAGGEGYAAYNIAAGTPTTTRTVVETMLALENWDGAVRYEGQPAAAPAAPRRLLTDRAARELGFRAEIGLEEGLGELLASARRRLEIAA